MAAASAPPHSPPPKVRAFGIFVPLGTSSDDLIHTAAGVVGLREVYSAQHLGVQGFEIAINIRSATAKLNEVGVVPIASTHVPIVPAGPQPPRLERPQPQANVDPENSQFELSEGRPPPALPPDAAGATSPETQPVAPAPSPYAADRSEVTEDPEASSDSERFVIIGIAWMDGWMKKFPRRRSHSVCWRQILAESPELLGMPPGSPEFPSSDFAFRTRAGKLLHVWQLETLKFVLPKTIHDESLFAVPWATQEA
ncbi:hypothetical protein HPB47_014630 [Ixodes persulcatus]|uniref:Uncharacterized protein n=1 Tax=Ixodes persulcatus TaxID=34615 RepID=A0AC60QVK3_IXOPE|nr:hypothetical protein HPB47_014630 [Ixodes persulcatus]